MTLTEKNLVEQVSVESPEFVDTSSAQLHLLFARDEIQLAISADHSLKRLSRFSTSQAATMLQYRLLLKDFFESEVLLQRRYQSVHLLFAFPKLQLIPNAFFSEQLLPHYLNIHKPDQHGRRAFHQRITKVDCQLAFSLSNSVLDIVTERLDQFKIEHALGPFLEEMIQDTQGERFLLQLRPPMADILVIKQGKLGHVNQISYGSERDLLYYNLNHMARAGLLWSKQPIEVLGNVSHLSNLAVLKSNGAVLRFFESDASHYGAYSSQLQSLSKEALRNFHMLLCHLKK